MAMDMDKMRRGKKMESKWDIDDIAGYEGGSGTETVAVEYDSIEHVTDKAALVCISGDNYWLPKSQIVEGDDEYIIITRWFAEKENIPYI